MIMKNIFKIAAFALCLTVMYSCEEKGNKKKDPVEEKVDYFRNKKAACNGSDAQEELTAEIAVYQMSSNGLEEILNPSEMFIPMHSENLSGVAVAAMLDGSRPFLIEVQSLVSSAAYGTPQRSATGFDVRRLNMLLAVLEKRVGFKLGQKDVFLNIAGGLKVSDPACDLAIVAAILSSNFDTEISSKYAFAAEIGLSGEIRPVSQIEKRILEASKLGFEKIFVSAFNKIAPIKNSNLKVVQISNIGQLVKEIF